MRSHRLHFSGSHRQRDDRISQNFRRRQRLFNLRMGMSGREAGEEENMIQESSTDDTNNGKRALVRKRVKSFIRFSTGRWTEEARLVTLIPNIEHDSSNAWITSFRKEPRNFDTVHPSVGYWLTNCDNQGLFIRYTTNATYHDFFGGM